MQACKYFINMREEGEGGRKGGVESKRSPTFFLLISYVKFLQDLPLDNIQTDAKERLQFVKGVRIVLFIPYC